MQSLEIIFSLNKMISDVNFIKLAEDNAFLIKKCK